MKTENITPKTMIEQIRRDNPTRQFALSDKLDAVGVWDDVDSQYDTVCGRCIDGRWVRIGNLLINGKPVTTYHNAEFFMDAKSAPNGIRISLVKS